MNWDEYLKEQEPYWSLTFAHETKIPVECPYCHNYIYRDEKIVYTSLPPKHRYFCKECGWEGIA